MLRRAQRRPGGLTSFLEILEEYNPVIKFVGKFVRRICSITGAVHRVASQT